MHIDDELKEFLRAAPFAVAPTVLDLGGGPETVLIVKSTGDLLRSLKQAAAPVRVGWIVEPTDAGPVACLVLSCRADGVGELAGEAFFDWDADADKEAFEKLAAQEAVRAAFFDEEMELVWFTPLRWEPLDRLCAEQALDRAEQLWEEAENPDPEAARQGFQERYSLEEVTEKVILDDES